ncbi:hypothetical protein [Streptomyces sp. NPDC048606]|uniref:hypothetical protein n=1 Tax=Streptomyces sp. NPDC048606 TaxID=3154726 RepID=UPI0034159116
MTRFEALLRTDFEGNRTDDVQDVIWEGLDHPEHRERVPDLTALMEDASAPDFERYWACLTLVAWAEPAGYRTVQEATRDPRAAFWYGLDIDRRFSVDRSYGLFSQTAADSHEMAQEKNSSDLLLDLSRSLIRIGDREYFDDRLGDCLATSTVRACLPDVRDVIVRGLESIDAGVRHGFDLPAQLVDLANAVVLVDEELGVDLITRVLHAGPASGGRTMAHAVTGALRSRGPAGRGLAEYLALVGNDHVRSLLAG